MSVDQPLEAPRLDIENGDHAKALMRGALKREMESELRGLIMAARMHGFVLTIDLEPAQPLAMGNYTMVGHVREAKQ